MWPNPKFPVDLITFTEDTLMNGKRRFLYSDFCSCKIFYNLRLILQTLFVFHSISLSSSFSIAVVVLVVGFVVAWN